MEQDRDGSAPADYSAALRAGDHSERAAQLDELTRAGHLAEPEPLRPEAHSWQAGFLVDPCLASPVSPKVA